MRAGRVFHAVDSHTEGMPTRVITGGVGVLPGDTMLERKLRFERERDWVRTLLMHEPRGHGAMSGAILQPPCREDADWGVLFIEVSGCLPMCGHGTIGVATVLVETGRVEVTEPETVIRLDVPAGLVEARVRVEGGHARSVTLRNVESFMHEQDATANGITYDMAFGGTFYAIAPAASVGLEVRPENAPALIAAGLELMAAVPEPVHPDDPAIRGCHHVIWTEGNRSATAIHPGWVDRSPCGTGTSARMAALHARGDLQLNEPFEHRSIIDTRFVGRLVEKTARGVIPEITGRAWITGSGTYVLDPEDPDIRGCRHVVWTAPGVDGADSRSATAIHPGWVDRSPCGTGTSARMAQLWSRGELALGAPFVNEGIIGTRFTGRLLEETTVGGRPAAVPEITGRAWITGMGQYLLDPEDPFPHGFRVG